MRDTSKLFRKHPLLIGCLILPSLVYVIVTVHDKNMGMTHNLLYGVFFLFTAIPLSYLAWMVEKRQQQLEEEIQYRDIIERQLRQAQKMELVGQLSSGMIHDFRNMLTVVLLNLDHTRHTIGYNINITNAINAVEKAATAIQSTLSFGKTDDSKSIEIDTVLKEMTPLLKQALGSKIMLWINSVKTDPILISKSQFELAILNLVLNSRDAMPDGGLLKIDHSQNDQFVSLTIEDSGVGMTPEALNNMFVPFYTTKEKGTGLGLAMVNNFVAQSGGKIKATSVLKKGTTITLYFPIVGAYVPLSGLDHQK